MTVSLRSMARSAGAGLPCQPGRWPGDSCAAPGGARRGRKEVAIPMSAVTRVDAGIRVDLTKEQVEDLPTG